MGQKFVPVVSSTGKPLMPTTNKKANKLIEKGRALRRFDRGLFYIKLVDREDGYTQPIAVGIDPGSKKEGFSVKSEAHTYLNIQADAVTWVSAAVETRRMMRHSRRQRNTPYRECRPNRSINAKWIPPSTRARWDWKLRLSAWLSRRFPISQFVVEDIAAVTKPGKRKWNKSFSPLEVGKLYFYEKLIQLAPVHLLKGYDTYEMRNSLGLKKLSNKMSDEFETHCVDSWVLANWYVGGHAEPDNEAMLYIVPLRFHRRQLHVMQYAKGGVRRLYGGTRSMGFKRGSWVSHPKWGICYIGGTSKERVSLHNLQDGKRLTKSAKPQDLTLLCTSSWRLRKENAC